MATRERIASDPTSTAVERDAPTPGTKRLISLDAFRGWTMFWIVGGEALVVGLKALAPNALTNGLVYELSHTEWQGLRFYDLIWPSFMLMTGMSVPLSYAKRSLTQTHHQIFMRVLRRCIILFLLGSLRESISFNHPYLIELSSALQPIAVAYFAAFLLVRKSWRVQAAAAAGILVFYALLLAFVPAPGVPAGSYARDSNLVLWTDLTTVGRVLPEHWGTMICTLPTISTTILGMLIGELLMTGRSAAYKMKVIALVGISGVALGWALNPVIPIIMKLWTTSYGLASAGWACLLFLFFYSVIDVRGYRKWAFPFVIFGVNAVAIYMSQSIIPWHEIVAIFTVPLKATLGSFEPLLEAIIVLGIEWLVLYWMHKRKIFLTA
ncbi:MAG: acyltransferase family protein [Bryobacteraceae bacterium]